MDWPRALAVRLKLFSCDMSGTHFKRYGIYDNFSIQPVAGVRVAEIDALTV